MTLVVHLLKKVLWVGGFCKTHFKDCLQQTKYSVARVPWMVVRVETVCVNAACSFSFRWMCTGSGHSQFSHLSPKTAKSSPIISPANFTSHRPLLQKYSGLSFNKFSVGLTSMALHSKSPKAVKSMFVFICLFLPALNSSLLILNK